MSFFIKHVNEKSLFLIDEFGSGTDPSLGGSVAQSILEELNRRKSYGIITTHYLNLKTFANKTKGVENGAMLFDETTLKPLYKLEVGKPGSSYTFAIAKTSGLPTKIVKRAKEITDGSQVELDELLTNTQQSQSEMLIQQLELEKNLREFEQQKKQLNHLKKKLEEQKAKYVITKKDEDLRVKSEVKKQFDAYVKQLESVENKQKGAQHIREKLKNELETTKQVLQKKVRIQAKKKKGKKANKPIAVGDEVKWIRNGQVGKVVELKNKTAEVIMGALRTTIPLADLIPEDSPQFMQKRKSATPQRKVKPTPKSFSFEIDIRGKRYEEAEIRLQEFFDNAILANATWLRILHGKGSGVLRELTKKLAKQYKAVQIDHPHFEEGGDGVTIVQF